MVSEKTVQPADAAAFLESNLPLIETVVAEVARRQRVRGDQLDEFRSLAYLKLIEHDYAVLRRFEGASSLRTYLTVVFHRVLLDHRNREWGRWRPSAAAHRNGPAAVRLERMVTRDGLTPDEAIAIVGAEAGGEFSAAWLQELRGRTPVRGARSTLGEDAIPECADPAPGPEALAEQSERGLRAAEVRRRVHDAIQALDQQDRLILTLRFRDGLSVADISRVLDLPPKPLYRRLDRILLRLERLLCGDRRTAAIGRELSAELWCHDDSAGEYEWWGPSNSVGEREPEPVRRDDVPRPGAPRSLHRRAAVVPRANRETSV